MYPFEVHVGLGRSVDAHGKQENILFKSDLSSLIESPLSRVKHYRKSDPFKEKILCFSVDLFY